MEVRELNEGFLIDEIEQMVHENSQSSQQDQQQEQAA